MDEEYNVIMKVDLPAANVAKLISLADEEIIVAIKPKDKNLGTVEVEFQCTPQQLFDLGVKMGQPSGSFY